MVSLKFKNPILSVVILFLALRTLRIEKFYVYWGKHPDVYIYPTQAYVISGIKDKILMNRFDVITILFKFDPVLDASTVPNLMFIDYSKRMR